MVFQKACTDVFGDVKDEKLNNLIQTEKIYVDKYNHQVLTTNKNGEELTLYESTLKDYIDKPLWKIQGVGNFDA